MSEIYVDVTSLPPALQTAYQYLAESNWRNANDCFDLALKQSPLDPYACLGKAMTACYLKTPEELNYCSDEILDNPFFSAALKYAEGDLKDQLTLLVVKLNYERQKALSLRPAIETAAGPLPAAPADPETDAGPGPQDGDPRYSWFPNDLVKPQGDADGSETPGDEAKNDEEEASAGETEDDVAVVEGSKKSKKLIIAPIAAAAAVILVLGGALAVWLYLIPLTQYNKAVDLINEKKYDEGLAILEELGEFSDAPEQYKTGLYVKGLNYLSENDFENSKAIFEELGDFKDSQELLATIDSRRVTQEIRAIAAAQVGDIVTFGKYETDGNEENGEEALTWLVLNNRDDLVTLITEKSIAGMRYHFKAEETNWSDCSLRSWLNGTFYTAAFEMAESDFICKNYITTPTNPDFPSPSGDATVDKVYLLSLNEALTYFSSITDRKLKCTDASYATTYTDGNDYCCWWLRTPGAQLSSAAGVDTTGQVMSVGFDCYGNEQIGVRPVIVIDISAVNVDTVSTAATTDTANAAEQETTDIMTTQPQNNELQTTDAFAAYPTEPPSETVTF